MDIGICFLLESSKEKLNTFMSGIFLFKKKKTSLDKKKPQTA